MRPDRPGRIALDDADVATWLAMIDASTPADLARHERRLECVVRSGAISAEDALRVRRALNARIEALAA